MLQRTPLVLSGASKILAYTQSAGQPRSNQRNPIHGL